MGTVIYLAGRVHVRASSSLVAAGLRNASIGTRPPDNSLSRFAKLNDASLRPAKMLRKCASEHSALEAKSLTERPTPSAQRAIGWNFASDMGLSISARNADVKHKIFLSEKVLECRQSLKSVMAKRNPPEPRNIYLGEWLERAGISVTEAAEIAGCTPSYISNIKAGSRDNINVLYLLSLSEKIGICVNDFFQKPPSEAQVASIAALSPEAQEMLLRTQRAKR